MATEGCDPMGARALTKQAIPHQPSLSNTLQARREQLEDELKRVKAAQEALAKNPELQQAFDAVSQCGTRI